MNLRIKDITVIFRNRVGGKRKLSSYFHFPTSHTTVRAVRHTAVPILDTIRDNYPSA